MSPGPWDGPDSSHREDTFCQNDIWSIVGDEVRLLDAGHVRRTIISPISLDTAYGVGHDTTNDREPGVT